jgi:hypothetical protein
MSLLRWIVVLVVLWFVVGSAVVLVLWSTGPSGPDRVEPTIVTSKSVSGQFAAAGTSATVRRPKGAAIRFLGRNVQGGRVFWACRKGVSRAGWSGSYRWGLHVLPHVRGKDSCYITAGASSEGRITIQILELR